jgi:LCP family protein required for cell wall assembly
MSIDANYYYSPGTEKKRKSRALKVALGLLLALVLAGTAYGAFFGYKIYSLGKKINPDSPENATSVIGAVQSLLIHPAINLKGYESGRINILLLGVAGEKKPGSFLTDTIMIASINTRTNQVALFSIPRDLYVKIADTKLQTKINSVYQYGLEGHQDSGNADTIEKTIKNITGLEMDYYAVLNFDGFQKIINAIGGINVMNERDIFDPRYPGPNYSYETFELKKGFQHLDGEVALKYARERHNDPEGDFGRAKRQQQILQATKNKIFSTNTLLNVMTLNNLFDALGETIRTDIQPEEIGSFMELAKKLDTQNINNMVVDAWNKDSLLKVAHVPFGNVQAFVLIPRVGNYSEVQELAQNIFDLNKIKRKKEEIANEAATLAILNQSGDPDLTTKIKKLLSENLDHKNVLVLTDPTKTIQDSTVVYDFNDGTKPFTLNELVEKLPATPGYEIDPTIQKLAAGKNIDLVIRIGKDLEDIYNKEDATLDDLNNARDEQQYLNLLDNQK